LILHRILNAKKAKISSPFLLLLFFFTVQPYLLIHLFIFRTLTSYLQSLGRSFAGSVVAGDLHDQIPAHGCSPLRLKSNATTALELASLTGMMLKMFAPSGATLFW
jgi:hypothetical protein